jgi:hypothetical protein
MNLLHSTRKRIGMTERLERVVGNFQLKEDSLMLKIIAAMAASLALLAGLALAVDEQSAAGQTPTDTPTPAASDTPTPAATASPTAATSATPTASAAAAGTGTATPRAATVTPAAVPGTGGEPGSSTNLLLILAIGAGLVAGTAGLAGVAITRRS